MACIEVYSKSSCPPCARASALLHHKGLSFVEYDVSEQKDKRREMIKRTGKRKLPQIFIDDLHIGDSDDLYAAEASGELEQILTYCSDCTPGA